MSRLDRLAVFLLAFLPSPTTRAQFVYPLTVQNNGSTINNQTLTLNLLPGCTATKSGTVSNVTCPGAGGPFLPLAGGSMTNTGTGIKQTFPSGSSLGSAAFTLWNTNLAGSGGDYFQLNPNDSLNQDFRSHVIASTNLPGDSQNDIIISMFQYNVDSGSVNSTTDGSYQVNFESHCAVATGCGTNQMERYDTFSPPTASGVSGTRYLTCNQQIASPYKLTCGLVADTVGLGVPSSSPGGGTINDNTQVLLNKDSVTINGKSSTNPANDRIVVSATNGVQLFATDNKIDIGATMPTTAGHYVQLHSGWPGEMYFNTIWATIFGANVASATSITPTGVIFHLTGTTAVSTISVPNATFNVGGYGGTIYIICDSACVFSNANNLATSFTGVPKTAYAFHYDNAASKWYPSWPIRWYNGGATLVAGDFAPGAGFGSTASISAVLGHDGFGEFKVTAGGVGLAANATVQLTFHDGTWTTVPLCHAWTEAATGVTAALNTPLTDAETATTYTITYNGVALTAGDTITISFLCEGT